MYLRTTECCAIQEIDGLKGHADAKEAMLAFCKQNFGTGVLFKSQAAYSNSVYSFYLFSASLESGQKPYGKEFEEFIKENELGTVWASPKRVNHAFHPDHSNQVWVWMPDVTKLKAWWEKNKPIKKIPAGPRGSNVDVG